MLILTHFYSRPQPKGVDLPGCFANPIAVWCGRSNPQMLHALVTVTDVICPVVERGFG